MKRVLLPVVLGFLSLAGFAPDAHAAGLIKVACVGDSITFGMGAPKGWSYSAQLQRMLGAGYEVKDYGVSGATLFRHGDKPYEKQADFAEAKSYMADVVALMLGTNDTKPENWTEHQGEFDADYRWLVKQLRIYDFGQRFFVCRLCWVADGGKWGINDATLMLEIPIIDKVASSTGVKEIDMHAATIGHPEDFVDTVHPNAAGAGLLARAAYKAIVGKEFVEKVAAPAP